jgi:hypothetical protein
VAVEPLVVAAEPLAAAVGPLVVPHNRRSIWPNNPVLLVVVVLAIVGDFHHRKHCDEWNHFLP